MTPSEWRDKLFQIKDAFLKDIGGVSPENLDALEIRYLGRKGELSILLRELKDFPIEERKSLGQDGNSIKTEMESLLAGKKLSLSPVKTQPASGGKTRIDVTLPGYPFLKGSIHPISFTVNKLAEVFMRLGFTIADGPHIEDDYHNFEALNIPQCHPSRDAQDTFYLAMKDSQANNLLLRTHTSPVQIRTMMKHKPPLRIISPGRVFRRDALDASHSFVFHQIEGFYVDRNVGMADLKWTMEAFIKELFGSDTRLRFRPSYFPFVEPGAEVDMTCVFCRGRGNRSAAVPNEKCPVCKGSGWLEMLGAGVIHPNVLKACSMDPVQWSGFAFGAGIERFAMLLFEIRDMRIFYENDLRILKQL